MDAAHSASPLAVVDEHECTQKLNYDAMDGAVPPVRRRTLPTRSWSELLAREDVGHGAPNYWKEKCKQKHTKSITSLASHFSRTT